jgi:hypothetical protein
MHNSAAIERHSLNFLYEEVTCCDYCGRSVLHWQGHESRDPTPELLRRLLRLVGILFNGCFPALGGVSLALAREVFPVDAGIRSEATPAGYPDRRPQYADYIRRTHMFFPGAPKQKQAAPDSRPSPQTNALIYPGVVETQHSAPWPAIQQADASAPL